MGGSRSQESMVNAAVAIDKDKNSQFAVKWAIDNLNICGFITIVHVKTQLNLSPKEAVPKEGRAPTQEELKQFFLPYRGYCARKGVRVNEVVLNDGDVASALAEYVIDNSIAAIVLGSSSRSALTRAFKNQDIQASLVKSIPDFCSVYAVSKVKSQLLKSAKRSPNPNSFAGSRHPNSQTGSLPGTPLSEQFYSQGSWRSSDSDDGAYSAKSSDFMPGNSRNSPSNSKFSSPQHSGYNYNAIPRDMQSSNRNTSPRHPLFGGSSPDKQSNNSMSTSPFNPMYSGNGMNRSKIPPSPVHRQTQGSPSDSVSSSSDRSGPMSFQSSSMSFEQLDQPRSSDASRSSYILPNQGELEEEMRRLRQELERTMEMYNSACREALAAKDKANEVDIWKSNEARKIEEGRAAQEAAVVLMEMEKTKCKAAIEAAQMAQCLAELESQKRKQAEMRLLQESEEKKKAMDALARCDARYRRYTIEEIEQATDHFSTSEKIGEGGYGPVYKAHLDHTAVAIKVLRPDISQGQQQFQREIEVLSRMRHPNMVLLLGACPEYGCLVYEYMENGSLEDRLFCRNGSSPIPWRVRFRIAAEIATALLFLHQTRPEPLVHRDLKPANILLDKNYVSKIGDVGLSRLVPSSVADSVTQYHMTAAAGTFCYIDPEYQQSGMLGTKSDIYSFGVVLLQLITAKPAMGLTYQVEEAIEQGTFSSTLDPRVADWPVEEALSLAKLALQCCELRKKDRPDLGTVVLPVLERLRDLGYDAEATGDGVNANLQNQNSQESLPFSMSGSSSLEEERSQSSLDDGPRNQIAS
ncbi:OLC1v1015088C2 [Oldenlandia corymbosa var. corymbosa]|uniref:RING-type E3 ubiquitin transferase n=1 Tax=Oldenlandia corymbosa var. corymbosa TaxID=529605 RepID=A0AAV1E620_OLDCO|nr:OLC1v1015088C2 [Oldenlandia corymbosa var. corymbosa]